MPKRESTLERLTGPIRRLLRPDRKGRAAGNGSEEPSVAARDGGWAELLSSDGHTRYGRGHLMIWPAEPQSGHGDSSPASQVRDEAVQPTGEGAPNLRGELRSFVPDAAQAPAPGDRLSIRPERGESEMYSVVVRAYTPASNGGGGVVALDWPDDELPASLRELGGH
ncbi:MAG: hypothetical protein WD058_00500 [Dehalococcoidia bacterium]